MTSLFQPFIELWKRLSIGQRAGLIAGVGILAAIVLGTVNYATRPVMVTLYSGLNPQDAGKVVEELREKKIPVEVSANGSTVKVPQASVGELRLAFASQGIPSSGGLGYELFDKPMLGMTDFMQRMNLHRALEGEIARTIEEIEAVDKARVHLVTPTPRLFREDQKPATASIILQLKPGAVISREQVHSIAYMTAYAVEGLEVEHITVVDTRGNLLSEKTAQDEFAGLSNSQLEVQKSVESDLEQKALALLENALGPGKAEVKVTAKLNWNRLERTVENYDGDRAATLSEERNEATGDQTDQGSGTSERSVTNFQIPRTVEKYIPETGNVERLTASVVVDGVRSTQKNAEGNDTVLYRDRTPQELDKLRTLVATAIGYDLDRQDELTVVSFPLGPDAPPAEMPAGDATPFSRYLKYLDKLVLVVALVLLFLLVRSLIGRLSRSLPALPEAVTGNQLALGTAGGQYMLAGSGRAQGALGAAAHRAQSPAAGDTAGHGATATGDGHGGVTFTSPLQMPEIEIEDTTPNVQALRQQELLRRTTDYVIKKPENATQILRSWILEDATDKHAR